MCKSTYDYDYCRHRLLKSTFSCYKEDGEANILDLHSYFAVLFQSQAAKVSEEGICREVLVEFIYFVGYTCVRNLDLYFENTSYNFCPLDHILKYIFCFIYFG